MNNLIDMPNLYGEQLCIANKIKGCIYGLAIGDAIGMPLEFISLKKRNTIGEINKMYSGGEFESKYFGELPAGTWTDDTSMSLCLAHSLLECNGSNLHDQLTKYFYWLSEGYMSCTGRTFDAGKATKKAVANFLLTGNTVNGDETTIGNGALMRLAPAVIFFYLNMKKTKSGYSLKSLEEFITPICSTTHNSELSNNYCNFFAWILFNVFVSNICKKQYIKDELCKNNKIDINIFNTPGLPTGDVENTLKSVLYSFDTTDNFYDAITTAINIHGDSDTVGAITGALAGAYYGFLSIPNEWINTLQRKDLLEDIVLKLMNFYIN